MKLNTLHFLKEFAEISRLHLFLGGDIMIEHFRLRIIKA